MRAIAILLILASGEAFAQDPPPPTLDEIITVTATRRPERIDDSAASVITIDRDALVASAPVALDEKLRQVPGFTLFRRAGSRFAHPTAQGVSLRGIGASGASRALVLDDGVPLNDPFGGWVQWGLVPRQVIDSVEILRGGGSDLYGSTALGGVIQLIRSRPADHAVTADVSIGTEATFDGSLFAAGPAGALTWHAAAQRFSTAGYVLVPHDERGSIDVEAASEQTSAEVALHGVRASSAWSLRAGSYDEERDNGTALQVNSTRVLRAVASADLQAGASAISVRAFSLTEEFDAAFSAIANDRASERLTRLQHVPADAYGVSATWSSVFGGHTVVAGGDARSVQGRTEETGYAAGMTFPSAAGGAQLFAGAFVEDVWRHGRTALTAAARFDWWGTSSAFSTSGGERASLPSSDTTSISPRASILWKAFEPVALVASAYRSFRAPTLNELYRGFRVGNVVTGANPLLGPETLTGAEVGVNAHPASRRIAARARLFWNEVDDTVANVTLRVTPDLIERQRQNLGTTRSIGLEIDGDARVSEALSLRASLLRTDTEVVAFAENPALEGNRLPQIPGTEASLGATFRSARGLTAATQLRYASAQFEDDRNELTLGALTVVDVFVSAPLGARFDLFTAVENAFDERFDIGRTPTVTLAPPRLARVGVRARLPF
jgi:outer membrane receptor protein involved in Fe transport